MSEDTITNAAGIVAAFVSNNSLRPEEFLDLISAVHTGMVEIKKGPVELVDHKPIPIMPWKKTINRDFLISLEDGNKYKTLKRHLNVHGMTPDDYRSKWDLPKTYPMVCAAYSEVRSEFAKNSRLGQKNKAEKPSPTKSKGSKHSPLSQEIISQVKPKERTNKKSAKISKSERDAA